MANISNLLTSPAISITSGTVVTEVTERRLTRYQEIQRKDYGTYINLDPRNPSIIKSSSCEPLTYNGPGSHFNHIQPSSSIVFGDSTPSYSFTGQAYYRSSKLNVIPETGTQRWSFWFLPTTDGGTAGTYDTDGQGIISLPTDNGNQRGLQVIWHNSTLHVYLQTTNGTGGYSAYYSKSLPVGVPHHVSVQRTVTYKILGSVYYECNLIVFVNGERIGYSPVKNYTRYTTRFTDIFIGALSDTSTNNFVGYLQHLRYSSNSYFSDSNGDPHYGSYFDSITLYTNGLRADDYNSSCVECDFHKYIYSNRNPITNAQFFLPLDDASGPPTLYGLSGSTVSESGTIQYNQPSQSDTNLPVVLLPVGGSGRLTVQNSSGLYSKGLIYNTYESGFILQLSIKIENPGSTTGSIYTLASYADFEIRIKTYSTNFYLEFYHNVGSGYSWGNIPLSYGQWNRVAIGSDESLGNESFGYVNGVLYNTATGWTYNLAGNLIIQSPNADLYVSNVSLNFIRSTGWLDGSGSTIDSAKKTKGMFRYQPGINYSYVEDQEKQLREDYFDLQSPGLTYILNVGEAPQYQYIGSTGIIGTSTGNPIAEFDQIVTLDSTQNGNSIEFEIHFNPGIWIKIDSWNGAGDIEIASLTTSSGTKTITLERISGTNTIRARDLSTGLSSPAGSINLGQWNYIVFGEDNAGYIGSEYKSYISCFINTTKYRSLSYQTQVFNASRVVIGSKTSTSSGWSGAIAGLFPYAGLDESGTPLFDEVDHTVVPYLTGIADNAVKRKASFNHFNLIEPLDEVSGSPTPWISPSSPATLTFEGPSPIYGRQGPVGSTDKAVRFTSNGSYLYFDYQGSASVYRGREVEGWFKINNFVDADAWLLALNKSSARGWYACIKRKGTTSEIVVEVNGASSGIQTSALSYDVPIGIWFHLALEMNPDNYQYIMYVNGVEKASVGADNGFTYDGNLPYGAWGAINGEVDVEVSYALGHFANYNASPYWAYQHWYAGTNPDLTVFENPTNISDGVPSLLKIYPETPEATIAPVSGTILGTPPHISINPLVPEASITTSGIVLLESSLINIIPKTLTWTVQGSVSNLTSSSVSILPLIPEIYISESHFSILPDTSLLTTPNILETTVSDKSWVSMDYSLIQFSEFNNEWIRTEDVLLHLPSSKIELKRPFILSTHTKKNWSNISNTSNIFLNLSNPSTQKSENNWSLIDSKELSLNTFNVIVNYIEDTLISIPFQEISIDPFDFQVDVTRNTDNREVLSKNLSISKDFIEGSQISRKYNESLNIAISVINSLEIGKSIKIDSYISPKIEIKG